MTGRKKQTPKELVHTFKAQLGKDCYLVPLERMTVAEATKLLEHPKFGEEEYIYARDLLELRTEVEERRRELGYRWDDLNDMTIWELREELQGILRHAPRRLR